MEVYQLHSLLYFYVEFVDHVRDMYHPPVTSRHYHFPLKSLLQTFSKNTLPPLSDLESRILSESWYPLPHVSSHALKGCFTRPGNVERHKINDVLRVLYPDPNSPETSGLWSESIRASRRREEGPSGRTSTGTGQPFLPTGSRIFGPLTLK